MSIDEMKRQIRVRPAFVCAHCGGREGYYGERQGLLERYVLPLMLIQPMRCCDCGKRSHWLPVGLIAQVVSGADQAPLARPAG